MIRKMAPRFFGQCVLLALLAACVTTGVEGLHNAHKKNDVEAVGSFAVGQGGNPDVRREAVKLLAEYPVDDALPFLEKSAKDPNSRVRAQTAKTLGSYNSKRALSLLTMLISDKSKKVKAWAIRGIAGSLDAGDTAQIEALKDNLNSASVDLRLATAELFAKIGMDLGRTETIQALDAPYYTDVRKAIQTLKFFKNEEDIGYLKKFLIAKDSVTRRMALESIEYIRGEKLDAKELAALKQAATELSAALTSGVARETIREKPTIYVAFPKGDVQVAETEIDFIGYVNSHNRTKNIEVLINNKPFNVARLWTDFIVDTKGLRGFPLRWNIPLDLGTNKIDVNVLDQAGFLVNHTVTVKRIKLVERTPAAREKLQQVANLPPRLTNVEVAGQSQNVTPENFMAVLGSWVKQTAKSDYNKGNSMFDQGRFERAAYYYRKSVKTDASARAYFNLGLTQTGLGKDKAAREAFQKACDLKEERGCEMAAKPSA